MRSRLRSASKILVVLALVPRCSSAPRGAAPAPGTRSDSTERTLFRYSLPRSASAPVVAADSNGGAVYAVLSDDSTLAMGRLDPRGRPRWRATVARRSEPAGVCLTAAGDAMVASASSAPESLALGVLAGSDGALKWLERFPARYSSIEGLSANDAQTVMLLRVSGWAEVGGRRLENPAARADSVPATGALAIAVLGAGGKKDFAWLPGTPSLALIGATDSGFVIAQESPPKFAVGEGPGLAADARVIAFDVAGRQRWDHAASGIFGLAAEGDDLALLVPSYAAQGPVQTYPPSLVELSFVRVHDATFSSPHVVWRRNSGSLLGGLAPELVGQRTGQRGARCSSDGPLQANRRGEILLALPGPKAGEGRNFVLVDRDGRAVFEHRCVVDATGCTLSLGDDGSVFESGSAEAAGRPRESYIERVR